MTVQNARPGVYSSYDVASVYTAPLSKKYAAVVARANGGDALKLHRLKSLSDMEEQFTSDSDGVFMRALVSLLFESGVSEILAVPLGDSPDYEAALALVEEEENIGAVICDAKNLSDLKALKASVQKSAEALRERVAFCGLDDPGLAEAAAEALNFERVVLACPAVTACGARAAVLAAAALAGKLLAGGDPAVNYNGEAFPLLKDPARLPEARIQSLLESGVTVFESVGGEVECIRALTTRTKTNGAPDRSLTGLNAILIIDDVLQALRTTLKSRLRGGRVSGASLESIHSQVMVVLAEKQSDGLLSTFSAPRCAQSASDPTVCVVELCFTVAHVVSQIHITAHIQV